MRINWIYFLWLTWLSFVVAAFCIETEQQEQQYREIEEWQIRYGRWEMEYIDKVCSGAWIDTEKLNPDCGESK